MSDNLEEFHWLVGLLEGEGCFLKPSPSQPNNVRIVLEMTDKDIVEKAARILEIDTIFEPRKRNPKYKQSYIIRINWKKAADWMKRLKPFMGQRRQKQIDAALAYYNPPRELAVIPSKEILKEMHKTMSLRDIAKQVGCSHQSILRHLNKE